MTQFHHNGIQHNLQLQIVLHYLFICEHLLRFCMTLTTDNIEVKIICA